MEFSFPTVLILPLGLGLLGFVEPCTVGGHLIFLRMLTERPLPARLFAVVTFALIRALVMALLGALVALLGQRLIAAQTTFWLVFGSVYVLVGLAYLTDRAGILKRRIDVAPSAWKTAASPVVLGIAFGLNIPACAAPILFGLVGVAAASGAVALGFVTMAVFGLALSLPLAPFAAFPVSEALAARLTPRPTTLRRVLAAVFLLLGAWSIWFGLFVDPADWALL